MKKLAFLWRCLLLLALLVLGRLAARAPRAGNDFPEPYTWQAPAPLARPALPN